MLSPLQVTSGSTLALFLRSVFDRIAWRATIEQAGPPAGQLPWLFRPLPVRAFVVHASEHGRVHMDSRLT